MKASRVYWVKRSARWGWVSVICWLAIPFFAFFTLKVVEGSAFLIALAVTVMLGLLGVLAICKWLYDRKRIGWEFESQVEVMAELQEIHDRTQAVRGTTA